MLCTRPRLLPRRVFLFRVLTPGKALGQARLPSRWARSRGGGKKEPPGLRVLEGPTPKEEEAMKKRFLSILLALCMATQFVPTAALAAQSDVVGNGTITALVATETEQGSDQGAGDGDNETALYNEAAINAVDETGDDAGELVVASMNGTDGSDAAAHTHCVCGGSITAGDHSEHTSATWTAWDGTSDIEYANGVASVYLSDNAARSNVLTVKDGSTLNLCLNGKTLSCSYTVIAVEGNATLNICDCKGGGQVASPSGCAVSVTTKNGSNAHTTLNLYGGKVSSKSYSMVDPGAIKLNNNDANNAQTVAVFNMYGGEVRHEDLNESAVYASYANIGSGYYQINMYGGNITCEKGNGFTSNNNQNVAIQVAGGTITAGWYGIWLSSQNTLTLSGNPKFVDKAYFDSNAGIYIPAEAALSVAGDFIPAEGTTISVTGDAVIARPAAGGSSLSGKAQYFVSSDEGYFVECNEDGNLQLTACAITDQPTADNGYAVAANGGSTDKVAYQWYKATSGKVAVTDKNATATGDFSYFGSSYGNEWYPRYDPESADQVTLEAFTLHMAKDDVLTVKYRNRDYTENNGPGRFDRFTLTGNDGEVEGIWGAEDWDTTYAFTAPADGDYTLKATVTPGTDEDPYDGSIYYNLWCDFSATVTADVAGDALSGQTAAALDTAELENGKYICGVTWEDKTTLYSNAVELSAPVHTHCVCGKTDCSGDGHDATTTWQPWTSDDSLPTGSGNYYLTDDVELSETWICGADVNLCLNGHDIIETSDKDAIKVNGNASLAITDCQNTVGEITHAENAKGCGINVDSGGILALWNGSIAGNTGNYDGGGVINGGTFTMLGGAITRNSASFDGGVFNEGTFTMSGGSITGNSATYNSGGVRNSGALNLSGNVTIKDNTAFGNVNNLNHQSSENIKVAAEGMGKNASVGITAWDYSSGATIVSGSTDTEVFFSDNANYELVGDGNGGLKLSAKTVTISGVKLLVSDGGSVMTEDQSKVYDGLAVAYDDSEVAVEPNTVTGWELSYTWQKATVTDGVTTYTDLDAAPSDAGSYRLLVTAKRGEVELGSTELPFTITKRAATFTGESGTEKYSGSVHELTGIDVEGLVDGQAWEGLAYSAKGTEPGGYNGAFSGELSIKTGGEDVTANYDVTKKPGKLTIDKSAIADYVTLTGTPVSKTYDGQALAAGVATAADGNGHAVKVEYQKPDGSWTEDSSEITATAVADSTTVNVRASVEGYYEGYIETNEALTISKRPVTLTSESQAFTYNGQAQGWNQHECTDKLFASQVDGLGCTATVTNVGETAENTVGYTFKTGFSESNYNVTKQFGTLSVTAQSIDPDDSDNYKGVQVGQPSDVEYNGQAQEQKPTVTDKDGNPLVEGVDYEISFSKDTVNAGEVTVTITGKGNYAGTVTKTYKITAKPLTIDHLVIAEKYYDGTDEASFIAKPVLVGVVSGDEVTLVNGVPTFTSVAVGRDIPISFTEFTLDGADAGNYALTQPSGITGDISAYNAFGTEYATTTTDWTNQDFVVTASSGWLVSETNTAEGTWSESLTRSAETGSAGDRLTFYVKSKDHGFISEAITKTYMIDKTVPAIKGARDGKTYCGAVVLTVTDANLDKVTVNGEVVEPAADEAVALAADAPAELTFTVQPAEGEQTVVATDKAGNNTTLKLTVNDGHTWGAWSSNGNGTHTHACEYDDSTETADCHGGTATCTDRAVCDDCGQAYGEVDASNHAALTHVEAKAATATAEGNIEYWYCEACGRYFADEAGAKEIQRSETVVAKKAEAPDGNKGGTTGGKTGGNTGGSAAGAGSGKSQVPRTGDSTAAAWPPAILGAAALAAVLVSARRRRS